MKTEKTLCRCPVRPCAAPGSFASGSTSEGRALERWMSEHSEHSYARVRDVLAVALQSAEGQVGGGEAVLDMVSDIFGRPRGRGMLIDLDRYKEEEDAVIRSVADLMARKVDAGAIVWTVVNALLRGHHTNKHDPECRPTDWDEKKGSVRGCTCPNGDHGWRWDDLAKRWRQPGATGPAVNWHRQTGA